MNGKNLRLFGPSFQLSVRPFCFIAAQVHSTHAAASRVEDSDQVLFLLTEVCPWSASTLFLVDVCILSTNTELHPNFAQNDERCQHPKKS